MATVTGLTADRMLAIEAASVVDGDVDASGNLILTQKGGTQINAGSVIGPPGPQGPVGSMLTVLTAQPVLDVGVINQIRAGRQLTAADFTNMGLSAPLGLWNLSDLSDASGNGRALSNKGAIGFAAGINGAANTAAQFTGSTAQGLYISDTGASDSFRIRAGSMGCWFRTAKVNTPQGLVEKINPAGGNYGYWLEIGSTSLLSMAVSTDGTNVNNVVSVSNVCDDRWHFGVGTYDGTQLKIYIDGVFEGVLLVSGTIFPSTAQFNIGGRAADGSTPNAYPHFGRLDEAFITADVLSEDQIRSLYCAKIPHTLAATPARFITNVRRRRRGAALAAADFPTQPLRLHNFSAGSLGDEGSNNVGLTSNSGTGSIVAVAGVDGSLGNSFSFSGAHGGLSATDAGLPSGVATRSFGAWLKTTNLSGNNVVISYGVISTGDTKFYASNQGSLISSCVSDTITGPFVSDGIWHFVIVVEDNGAVDGVKRKLYMDGRLVGISITMPAIALAGAGKFRIGANQDTGSPMIGQIDGAFVCDYALTPSQIAILYAKSLLTLSPSPKNPGDHIEGADANNLFAIFDVLESNYQVDVKVAS